jgi:hypothetical protein
MKQIAVVFVLALLVAFIAIRIEWLNHANRSPLPWPEDQTPRKWRYATATEDYWRRLVNEPPVVGELTEAQRAELQQYLDEANLENALHNWVSIGMLQYLLIPALILSIVTVLAEKRSKRTFLLMALPMVIALFAAASLWHRAYFSSMGTAP